MVRFGMDMVVAAIASALLAPCFAEQARETALWPSGVAELRAQPDSRIAPLPDGSMGVETGVKYAWPGVRMDFVGGEHDLSSFGRVTVAVSNTTESAVVVHLSVKGGAVQGQTPGGSVVLLPNAP